MKPWLLISSSILACTVLAVGAGWGVTATLGAVIGLSDDETLHSTRASDPSPGGDTKGEPTERARAGSPQAQGGARPTEPSQPATPRIDRQTYIDTIVHRNIFDHTNVGKAPTEAGDDREICLGDDCDEEIGEKTDLPLTLLGTLVTSPSDYSSAMLRNDNSKEVAGYHIGSQVLDATITSIQPRMVLVQRSDGAREYILMDEDDRAPSRSASPSKAGESEQIVKQDDDTYIIDRQLYDASLQDLDALSRMARAIPHKDPSGNIDGFRLSGVRRNQLLYNLGIRSGDVVHGVNGKPLTSIAEAMNAMQTLQRESNFTFEVTRRGQKKTMNYQVR